MSKLNLLMVNFEFLPIGGGMGKAHLSLLKEYARYSDLKIDVLTSAPKPGFFTERLSSNIIIYKVGLYKKHLHFWRKVEIVEGLIKAQLWYRRLLRQNNYGLVHAFSSAPSAFLCFLTSDKLPYLIFFEVVR